MPNFKKGVSSPEDFDSDVFAQAAIALKVAPELNHSGISPHDHRKGQLILSLRGAVSCEVQNALWLVPPQHAVWIPGGTLTVAELPKTPAPVSYLLSLTRQLCLKHVVRLPSRPLSGS